MSAELIAQGRRCLVCGEVSQAVESLQKACKQLALEHGELDERLGDPYLLYGSALLELARIESTVIGNALDGVPADDSSSESSDNLVENGPEMTASEKEDLSNQVIDAMCEEPKAVDGTDTENNEHPDEASEGDSSASEAESVAEGDEAHSDSGEAAACENGSGDEKSDASDDDVTNLQLAWEVIEVAKKIFASKADKDSKLKVAECYEKLAEISREKENYSDALSDLKECLSIRISLLPEDHRDIAEAHYQLGTTHAVAGDLDSACAEFKTTIKCLQMHSSNLELRVSEIEKTPEANEELESLRNALQDVKALIPDVERRLTEVEEDRLADRISAGSSEAAPLPSCNTSEPATAADDITHLIRKKRVVAEGEAKETIEKVTAIAENCSPEKKRLKLLNGSVEHVNDPTATVDVVDSEVCVIAE